MTINPEGTASPSPPPPLSVESATVSPIPLGRHLWDLLAVHGSLPRHELFHKAAIPIGEPWREYVRWNGLQGKKPTPRDLEVADRFYFDHAVTQSLRRGWLLEHSDGTLTAGECPPEHRALSTVGGVHDDGQPNVEALSRRMIGDEDRKALDLLRHKANPARRKRFKRRVDALRQSLLDVGQINDIVCWHPIGQPDPIFVDGQTRHELSPSSASNHGYGCCPARHRPPRCSGCASPQSCRTRRRTKPRRPGTATSPNWRTWLHPAGHRRHPLVCRATGRGDPADGREVGSP